MAKIKPIKINLVEQEGWETWDYAKGDISSWAMDNAWDDWKNMDEQTCQGYVEDLAKASLPKDKWLKLSSEDIERICEEMMEERVEHFESLSQAIIDAHMWAWEEAYTPDDRDIGRAMERAARNWDWDFRLADYWKLVLKDDLPEGPREWTPRKVWTTKKLYQDLIERILYERKPNYYDRYIVFDWDKSDPVQELVKKLKESKEGSVADVQAELEDWAGDYLQTFFKELDEQMQRVDINTKWNFHPHWKTLLGEKSMLLGVRKDLEDFLERKVEERKRGEV